MKEEESSILLILTNPKENLVQVNKRIRHI